MPGHQPNVLPVEGLRGRKVQGSESCMLPFPVPASSSLVSTAQPHALCHLAGVPEVEESSP